MAKSQEEHYQEFLSRIQTRDAFREEIRGKLKAIEASGFPTDITDSQIDFLCSVLPLNTIGKPPFWPPFDMRAQSEFDAQVAAGVCIVCKDSAAPGTRYCGGDRGCVCVRHEANA